MTAPDYSHYLSPDMLARTEIDWSKMDRAELIAAIMEHDPKTVVEFCCGTGWIPKGLPVELDYIGVDANEGCINLASMKNDMGVGKCAFVLSDIRKVDLKMWWGKEVADIALGFSCLKHFALAEWDEIYGKILRAGNKTLTSIYMTLEDREDEHHGFPHTSVTMERVERVCAANGHRIVKVFTLPPLNVQPEPLVLTERIQILGDTSTGRTEEVITEDDVGERPPEIIGDE